MPTKEEIIGAVKECYDPEIPVNIVDLGLIYDVSIQEEGKVHIKMTLTAVGCPTADQLVEEVRERAASVPGVTESKVELVWDPPWSPARLTPDGRLQLEMMGFPLESAPPS